MTPNDKLPETTQDRIKADADKWSDDQLRYVYAVEKLAYIEGATAWAGWKVRYDELKHEIALLKEVNNESLKLTERSQNRYAALQDKAQRMADALEELVSRFEGAAEMADQDIDTRIIKDCKKLFQQFKDGKDLLKEAHDHGFTVGITAMGWGIEKSWKEFLKQNNIPLVTEDEIRDQVAIKAKQMQAQGHSLRNIASVLGYTHPQTVKNIIYWYDKRQQKLTNPK